jgi:hypothetical protein
MDCGILGYDAILLRRWVGGYLKMEGKVSFETLLTTYCPCHLSWRLLKRGGREVSTTRSAHALLNTTFQNNIFPLYSQYEK